jgi:hypothetical protein
LVGIHPLLEVLEASGIVLRLVITEILAIAILSSEIRIDDIHEPHFRITMLPRPSVKAMLTLGTSS